MSHRITRSGDLRPTREIRPPARYREEDEVRKKRTADVAQGAIAEGTRKPKKVKAIQSLQLPKMGDSVRYSFVGKRSISQEQVKQEFLQAWEKAKRDPSRRNLRSRTCLIQDAAFIRECRAFFSKQNPNPFRITVEPATNPEMGRGAFITKGAKRGEVLGFYPLIVEKYSGRNQSDYLFSFDTVPELENFSLDAQHVDPTENFTPFINDIPGHTNVRFVPYYTEEGPMIVLVALEDFKKGTKTELSADYGKHYWDVINKTKQAIEAEEDSGVEKKEPPAKPTSDSEINQKVEKHRPRIKDCILS